MPKTDSKPALRVGDAAVKSKTGKTWAEWFAVLDKGGARKMNHKEIVAFLAKHHDVGPWWQQMLTAGYEQARGVRVKHQGAAGFEISKSVTVATPAARLFGAFQDKSERSGWLADPGFVVRKATLNKSLRITWIDGKTHLDVYLFPKGASKTQANVQHRKIPTAAEAERLKAYWAKQLGRLQAHLEA